MSTARWLIAIGALGTLACALWPLSPALLPGDALLVRATGAALTLIACAVIWLLKGGRPTVWLWVSAASALGAIILFIHHIGVSPECVADYAGRPTVIGRKYTPDGLEHVRANPDAARDPALLLLDMGGRRRSPGQGNRSGRAGCGSVSVRSYRFRSSPCRSARWPHADASASSRCPGRRPHRCR